MSTVILSVFARARFCGGDWRECFRFMRERLLPASCGLQYSPETRPSDNDEGRFNDKDAAAELLRGFLHHVQKSALAAGEAWWQALENSPVVFEYAKWIDAPLIERLLGALDMEGVPLSQFQFADRSARSRIIFEHRTPWMPLVGFDGRFRGSIDRSAVVELLARRNLDAR